MALKFTNERNRSANILANQLAQITNAINKIQEAKVALIALKTSVTVANGYAQEEVDELTADIVSARQQVKDFAATV